MAKKCSKKRQRQLQDAFEQAFWQWYWMEYLRALGDYKTAHVIFKQNHRKKR